jgi:hypothetical protein
MNNFEKQFVIDGSIYKFIVSKTSEISFALINERKTDDMGYSLSQTRITNESKNPFRVLKNVFEILSEYIFENYPPYFWFSAMEKSRVRVYNRFIKIIESELNYQVIKDGNKYLAITKPK